MVVVLGRRKRERRRRNHTRIGLIETRARVVTGIGIMIAIERAAVDVITRTRKSLRVVVKKRNKIDPEGKKNRLHQKNERKNCRAASKFPALTHGMLFSDQSMP